MYKSISVLIEERRTLQLQTTPEIRRALGRELLQNATNHIWTSSGNEENKIKAANLLWVLLNGPPIYTGGFKTKKAAAG